MTTKQILKLLVLLILMGLVTSCSNKKAKLPPFVDPPFDGLNPAYETFSFEVSKGDMFVCKTSTEIVVPPDAIVDGDGNPVSGNVELTYREFHDGLKIYLAGVPMQYDSAGNAYQFTTAGMFELRLKQDDEDLFIAPDKKIKVRMASYTEGSQYNFYRLNEEGRNWQYMGYSSPETNNEYEILRKNLETLIKENVFDISDSLFIMNYNAILDLIFSDYKDYSKIFDEVWRQKMMPKIKSYHLAWYDIKTYCEVKFYNSYYPASMMVWKLLEPDQLMNKNTMNKASRSYTEDDCQMIGPNTYMFKQYRYNNNYDKVNLGRFKAEAVMPLEELLKHPAEYWDKKYKELMDKISEAARKFRLAPIAYRTFDVTMPGYHNYDVIMKLKDNFYISSGFAYDPNYADIDSTVIYFVDNNKSFFKISAREWKHMPIAPDPSAFFFMALDDSTGAVFGNPLYRNINFDSLRVIQQPEYTFSMKTQQFRSENELRKLLGLKKDIK